MFHPPNLAETVKARAFRATNGELGIVPSDVGVFLNACRACGVEVLGWELWIVDHAWGSDDAPVTAPGLWCGSLPLRGATAPSIIGGEGDADEAQRQILSADIEGNVQPDWLPYVRINFTLTG